MSNADFDLDRLKNLLERRENYFYLDAKMRKDYQPQFEKMQKEIIALKIRNEIYHDELDLFSVKFSYIGSESKKKYEIMEKAFEKREIRWLKKMFDPTSGIAEYIGQVIGAGVISDPWLQEKYLEHMAKREGFLDCPWPTKLS